MGSGFWPLVPPNVAGSEASGAHPRRRNGNASIRTPSLRIWLCHPAPRIRGRVVCGMVRPTRRSGSFGIVTSGCRRQARLCGRELCGRQPRACCAAHWLSALERRGRRREKVGRAIEAVATIVVGWIGGIKLWRSESGESRCTACRGDAAVGHDAAHSVGQRRLANVATTAGNAHRRRICNRARCARVAWSRLHGPPCGRSARCEQGLARRP